MFSEKKSPLSDYLISFDKEDSKSSKASESKNDTIFLQFAGGTGASYGILPLTSEQQNALDTVHIKQ